MQLSTNNHNNIGNFKKFLIWFGLVLQMPPQADSTKAIIFSLWNRSCSYEPNHFQEEYKGVNLYYQQKRKINVLFDPGVIHLLVSVNLKYSITIISECKKLKCPFQYFNW